MATRSGLDDLSVPVSIIIGAVIIGGSIIFAGSRAGVSGSAVVAKAPATAATIAPKAAVQAPVDVKTVKANGPVIGSPTAPVTMAYWYDYRCSYCRKYEQEVMPNVIAEYVSTGKIRVAFKDMQFLGADSALLGSAGRAVWEVAPGKFPEWHKAAFDLASPVTNEAILAMSSQILGKASADKVMGLMVTKAATYKQALDADRAEGSTYGIRSTPTAIVGKQLLVGAKPYDQVKAAIDEALKQK